MAQVLAALVGMGWKQRDAQAMVDRAKPHVGPDTSASDAMRLALREGALPAYASCVREDLAVYSATHVGRDEGAPSEAMGLALRDGAPGGVSGVRAPATCSATHVGRGASRAAGALH